MNYETTSLTTDFQQPDFDPLDIGPQLALIPVEWDDNSQALPFVLFDDEDGDDDDAGEDEGFDEMDDDFDDDFDDEDEDEYDDEDDDYEEEDDDYDYEDDVDYDDFDE